MKISIYNVDNTSDVNKPVSTAQQTALDLKANQDTTYTKTEVDSAIGVLTDLAPETLDTFNELAAAIGDDAAFITTITDSIDLKAPLASPAFTGGATIDGHDILRLDNIGIEVQPWRLILDDSEEAFTTAIKNNIETNDAKVGITTAQASDITTNNAKVGITTAQASEITANNAKVGITTAQASDITANTSKVEYPYTTDFTAGVERTQDFTSPSGFTSSTTLESIYIGSNATSIAAYAFYNCTGLTSATIANGPTSIANNAFQNCSSLASIIIPDSVTSIGTQTFVASGLISVTISNSVTSIGSSAFQSCTGLATINCLATTAPTLGTNVFFSVAATTIQVPVGATGYGTTYGGLTVSYVL